MSDPIEQPPAITEDEEADDRIVASALRWSLLVIAVLGGAAAAVYVAAPDGEEAASPLPLKVTGVEVRQAPVAPIPEVQFTDITREAGIDFVHENGSSAEKLLPETMGGGCGFFDFDNDGDQDLLLTNSAVWPENRGADHEPTTPALYANDGLGHFTDVTEQAGLAFESYGMGLAFGDYDADGLTDIFFSAVGENRLMRNVGDGRFTDVTSAAGVAGSAEQWSTSCGWFDYDNDGDLDLLVCNYLDWNRRYDTSQDFRLTGDERAYGRPQNFGGTLPYLYRNEGDGSFTEVAEEAGLHIRDSVTGAPLSKSLGIAITDVDADGFLDVIVANDTVQNFLLHNQQDGTFREIAALAGIAYDDQGNARGAMGIDVATFRNSDTLGVAIGNFANEMTALYVGGGRDLLFVDQAVSTGLGPPTRLQLTFGIFFFDYDADGLLDLFAANGHLERDIHRVQSSQQYAQPPQLFRNCGAAANSEFVAVPAVKCGEDFVRPMVGRGAAYADIDADGDLDILIAALGQRPRLLRNDSALVNNWVRFRLRGSSDNPEAIGALVEVAAGGLKQRTRVMPTRSYLSQVELPVTFGLKEASQVDQLQVIWPDGTRQELGPLPANQLHILSHPEAQVASSRF